MRGHLSHLVKFKIGAKPADKKLDEVRQAILDVEERLARLSGSQTQPAPLAADEE